MAFLLFIDESGHDCRESPYEVLAGLSIEDRDLWNLVKAVQLTELKHFGMRYSHGDRELKAKNILKRKVFRQAGQTNALGQAIRRQLAKECLEAGSKAGGKQISALAQAKLAYVNDILNLCNQFNCKTFASILKTSKRELHTHHLRKDYAYLFERFFYYIEDTAPTSSGIIVFDELEKTKSHLLVQQMDNYFKFTTKGRQRASLIIPEPFFVHSDLTTGIQIADLIAYLLSWGFRTNDLMKPARNELNGLISRVCKLRHRTARRIDNNPYFEIWSIAVISDLTARNE